MKKAFLSIILAILFCIPSLSGCVVENDGNSDESDFGSLDFEIISKDQSNEQMDLSDSSFGADEESKIDEASETSEVYESFESFESPDTSDLSPSVSESISEEYSEETEQSIDVYAPITPIPETLETSSLDSFFDDSVFIGYSIMMHFGKYVNQWKIEIDESIMGDSKYCCGVGMNFTNNRKQTPDNPNNVLPKYKGKSYNFEDLPSATNSKSMYIGLMPYSELKYSSLENCIDYAINETIAGIEKIQEKNPDLHIVILSGTYNTGTWATGELPPERVNNANVRLFNIGVLEYCNQNDIDFIDVSTPMLDGRGYMPVKYASDRDYHIKKAPFKIWINIFRDYADKKQKGIWKNPETMPPLVKE